MPDADRPPENNLGLTQDLEIDRVCLRFEQQLRSGDQPAIEQFLHGQVEPQRCQLLRQLLLLEMEYRKGQGATVAAEEYLERFPRDRSLVQLALAEHARSTGPARDQTLRFTPAFSETPISATSQAAGAGQSDSSVTDSSHHGRFLPGTQLADRYRIVSLLGQGGMGEVYRADDLKLGQTVALKFLPKDVADVPQRLEYLLSEVRLARQISHPNVCRVYDIGEVEGQHFLSMEYVDGEDLKSLLRRIGHLSRDKGIQIAQQLCAGLAAAHEKGVLHRDLKPANIMIDGRGQVRITDFGLARAAGTAIGGEECAGTPAYMAPEQLLKNETSIQSDLYSLGLILYEMFTGERVQKSKSVAELREWHADSSPMRPPSGIVRDMEPAVERAIMRCLDRDPRERPRSALMTAAALPGGDPLAAAIAAGETPSPEMVAAAGGGTGLRPAAALACLAGVVVSLVIVCLLAGEVYSVNHAGLEKHPEDLAGDAREIIKHLGYDGRPIDEAYGFLHEGDDSIRFWYRQSPQPLYSREFANLFLGSASAAMVSFYHPPWTMPGELGLQLDPQGNVLWFRAVPPSTGTTGEDTLEPQWAEWFLTALDLVELVQVHDRQLTPYDAYDALEVWKGVRSGTGETLYVEAAAYGGKPTYMEVFDESRFDNEEPGRLHPSAPRRASYAIGTVLAITYFCCMAGALALAWRNLQRGRSDRRGALRLAFFMFFTSMTIWLLQSHHSVPVLEVEVFHLGLAQALLRAAQVWLWYIALEPVVRRFWPQTLISWTRLLDGRIRDPLVGRDLLLGGLAGALSGILFELNSLSSSWFGSALSPYRSDLQSLLGPTHVAGAVVDRQISAIWWGMMWLLLLVILRVVLRSRRLAALGVLVVFTLLILQGFQVDSRISWLLVGLHVALVIWLMVRFGLLAAVSTIFAYFVLDLPITLDLSAWYAVYGMSALGLVFAIALYGYFTSLGGRSLLRDAPPDETWLGQAPYA